MHRKVEVVCDLEVPLVTDRTMLRHFQHPLLAFVATSKSDDFDLGNNRRL